MVNPVTGLRFYVVFKTEDMYHPRFKGDPYLMGQKMGNIFKNAHIQFPMKLDDFQTNFGKKSGKFLKEYFPEAAEIKGITDVTGFDNELSTSNEKCLEWHLWYQDSIGDEWQIDMIHLLNDSPYCR